MRDAGRVVFRTAGTGDLNLSSGIAVDLNNVKLRAKLCKGLAKRGQSVVVPTKADECELATNLIVQRLAVVEPDVRQS